MLSIQQVNVQYMWKWSTCVLGPQVHVHVYMQCVPLQTCSGRFDGNHYVFEGLK